MIDWGSWYCRLTTALVIASLCAAAPAHAQTATDRATAASSQAYPVKPIRLILPFPAGAPSDMVGRAVGRKLSERLGQNLVPDNRVGAGGNLAMGAAAKAPPDGYTLLIASPSIALSPSLYSNLTYDAERDLVPIARLATIENVLLVHPSVPARTLKAIVARLTREVIRALEAPDMRQRLTAAGIDPWPGSPEDMARLVRSETARYAKIVQSAGMRRQ